VSLPDPLAHSSASDFMPDGKAIFTVGYDRTLKMWSQSLLL
jgi:hypothetical protein